MASRNDYIASIDIGTDKIAVLVAEKEDNDRLRIIGHNISPSDGVRKGSISAIDPLSHAISKIVDQTQKSFDLLEGVGIALAVASTFSISSAVTTSLIGTFP